jgi:tRNA-specific 2-thiouridylase
MPPRVIVAMSGGVDSSVAAARLAAAGLDVVGVTLHLWDYPDDGSVRGRCCAPEDVHDARRAADRIGIPHYTFDRRESFRARVVDPFVAGYLDGETPSPCVACNRGIKVPELLRLAERLGAEAAATGHYARIDRDGRLPRLLRARDRDKDQSYFLYAIPPDQLARLRFPLGDATKAEVRAEARRLGLPGADKGESQELCFVPTGRYAEFVAARAAGRVRPGPILDEGGHVVGEHAGVHAFTIGQRRALGVALGRRAYVIGIDVERASVRLGPRSALAAWGARLSDLTLAEDVTLPARCEAVVRLRARPVPADLRRADGVFELVFSTPVSAVVPGQAAVLYRGERVIGGGTIRAPLAAQPAAVLEAAP